MSKNTDQAFEMAFAIDTTIKIESCQITIREYLKTKQTDSEIQPPREPEVITWSVSFDE
jgi:hypothetical protein